MSEPIRASGLYLSLDVLFDTRIATLEAINPHLLEKNLASYYSRTSDVFEGVDSEKFLASYSRRNKETLKKSLLTPILGLIIEFVENTHLKSQDDPVKAYPKLYLNTYPYDLLEEEVKFIVEALISHFKYPCDIEIIHRDEIELTPNLIKANYDIMILYDWVRWLHHLVENKMFDTPCPDVTVIVPRLLPWHDNMEKLLKLKPKDKQDLFEEIKRKVNPFINLIFFSSHYFSLAITFQKSTETSRN